MRCNRLTVTLSHIGKSSDIGCGCGGGGVCSSPGTTWADRRVQGSGLIVRGGMEGFYYSMGSTPLMLYCKSRWVCGALLPTHPNDLKSMFLGSFLIVFRHNG